MLSIGTRSHRFSPSKNVSIVVTQAVVADLKNAAGIADKLASPRFESEIASKVDADTDRNCGNASVGRYLRAGMGLR